jgi:hypothetical protein
VRPSQNSSNVFRAEPFAQKIHEPRVHFNRQNFAGFFQKQFRQRPKSRPDFENFVRRQNFRRVDDFAQAGFGRAKNSGRAIL